MRDSGSTTSPSTAAQRLFGGAGPAPVVLVAVAPQGAVSVDRCLMGASFVIGRSSDCELPIREDKLSKRHLRMTRDSAGFFVEDLDSTNGTFLNGHALHGKQPMPAGSVIRCGRCIVVFHADGESMLVPTPGGHFGIAGGFHATELLDQLKDAALSARHVLITGPSGTGKELAAGALSHFMGGNARPLPMLAHNAAQFATEDEAATTLFGVNKGVFSGVNARAGLIEQARGGVLFLDEIHNLPQRVQRTLLRTIETGSASRIGESRARDTDVRFVFASNAEGPTAGLAHDLHARLRVVSLPALSERRADIPAIFREVLRASLTQRGLAYEPVASLLSGDHYEAMCLDGLPTGNVRELIDLADRIATRMAAGPQPDPVDVLASAFSLRFSHGIVGQRGEPTADAEHGHSTYERNRDAIVRAYQECEGNLSATERLLRARGIPCSRRWLAVYRDRWGL